MVRLIARYCGVLAAVAMLGAGSPAHAVTVTCPDPPVAGDRVFGLDTLSASSCLEHGPGNLRGRNDPITHLGYVLLDKSDDRRSGELPQSLSITKFAGGLSGTFSITAPGFASLVIAFKSGRGHLDPDWAAFLLPAGILAGTWSISGRQALSHANLYGKPSPVPLPGAVVLMGTVVAGGYGFDRWRRRRLRNGPRA